MYVHENTVKLVLKTSRNEDMIERAADILGVNMNRCTINRKPGVRITIQGEKLRRAMKMVWPYLMNDRRREYVEAVKSAAD